MSDSSESVDVSSLVSEPLPEPTKSEISEKSISVSDITGGGGESPSPTLSQSVDDTGQTHDPSLHWTDPETGKGHVVKKTGKWRGKPGPGRGAKPEIEKQETGSVIGKTEGEEAQERSAEASAANLVMEKCRATAVVTVGLLTQIPQMIFDPEEWKPSGDETELMVTAWTDYYRVQGVTDLPPWVNVAVAMGGYALPRLPQPKTLTRVSKLKLWFARLRDKMRGRKGHSDRTETKRTDDSDAGDEGDKAELSSVAG